MKHYIISEHTPNTSVFNDSYLVVGAESNYIADLIAEGLQRVEDARWAETPDYAREVKLFSGPFDSYESARKEADWLMNPMMFQ